MSDTDETDETDVKKIVAKRIRSIEKKCDDLKLYSRPLDKKIVPDISFYKDKFKGKSLDQLMNTNHPKA